MLKKIFLFITTLILLIGCSNVDPKKEFYNDSIVIEVEFDTLIESFQDGFLDISIWKYDEKEGKKNIKLVRDLLIKDVKHKKGKRTIKKYLVNLEEPFDEKLTYYVLLKVYKDSDKNGEMEVIHGKSLRDNMGEIRTDLKEVRFFVR